jgi:hypothetical protein
MKKIPFFLLLFFSLSTLFAQFHEDFEGDVFPPDAWITFNNGVGPNYDWQKSDDAFTGSGSAFVRWENVEEGIAEDWLVTPRITPTENAHILSFYQKDSYARDYFSVYTVRVSSSAQDRPEDFDIIDRQYESDMALYYSYHEVDLSDYIGQDIYLAFVMENDDGDNWIIDDVALNNCRPAEGLYTMQETTQGADLYWEDDGADFWSVEVVRFGEVPTGIPTATNIVEMPYTWNGGEAFTRYEFYVQSHCGSEGNSLYSSSAEFLTTCANDGCDYFFVLEDIYGDDWNGAYIEIRQGGITVGEITQLEDGYGPFVFPFSFCDDYPFELIWHAGNWDQECVFSFYDAYDQLFYAFKAGDSPGDGTVFYSGEADCDPVTCRFPFDLKVTDPSVHGAVIDWTDKDLVGTWDIEIVPLGSEPSGEAILMDLNTKPFVWTGGDPGTYYDVYVRSVCAENDRSKWSKPAVLATLCDDLYSTYPYEEDFKSDYELPYCWSKRHRSESIYSWEIAADTYTSDSIVLCSYDNEKQDEWLISPAFDFSGIEDKAILSFDWKTSYYWMVYPYDKGDIRLMLSLDRGESWSPVLWNEHDMGEFPSFEWQHSEVDLSAYIGEPEVWIAFQYEANDAASVYLDNFRIEDETGGITNIDIAVAPELNLAVYPNPAGDLLSIHVPAGIEFDWTISDINGKMLLQSKSRALNKQRVGLESLEPGIYFVIVSTSEESFSKKFVKL